MTTHGQNERSPLLDSAFFAKCQWEIQPLTDVSTFWQFMDLLLDEYIQTGFGFYCNRDMLLEAFMKGEFYVQSGWHPRLQPNFESDQTTEWSEEDDLWDLYHETTPTFSCTDFMIFPSFCVWDGKKLEFIWAAPQWRRLGGAKRFVDHFKPASVHTLPDSLDFWNKMKIPDIHILRGNSTDPHLYTYGLGSINRVVAHSIAAVLKKSDPSKRSDL